MGSDRIKGSRLAVRCCYGAYFGFGFVITTIALSAMFWIVWCYFGLTIVQFSDCQRRAVVNYSLTAVKSSTTPSGTTPPSAIASSLNSISQSPAASTVIRGSSRELSSSVTSSPLGSVRTRDDDVAEKAGQKAAILNADEHSREDSSEDRIYARRVPTSGTDNRPDVEKKGETENRPIRRNPSEPENVDRVDISPTKVYDYDSSSGRSRRPENVANDRPSRDEISVVLRDYADKDRVSVDRRDDLQSSRRPDSKPAYRDPEFDRDFPPRRSPPVEDRSRSRYDDDGADDRGSPSLYDRRDRGRESDDRYSKGDTRVYPDDDDNRRVPERERAVRPAGSGVYDDRTLDDDRYKTRDDRYSYDSRRRGDEDRYRDRDYDDRYKDRDDRYRYRSPDDDDRRKDRISEDRYRDDERYRARDEDDRYRSRVDDRYRTREDDRYRPREDDKYRIRDDDKYRSRDADRYRDRVSDDRPSDRTYETDRYRPRIDDDKDRDDYVPTLDRKSVPSSRTFDTVPETRERSRSRSRDDALELPARSEVSEDRYRRIDRTEGYRNPSPYDDREYKITATRVRDESYVDRSTFSDPRPRDEAYISKSTLVDERPSDNSRYFDDRRDIRPRDDKYYEDRKRTATLDASRGALSSSVSDTRSNSKREGDKDEYRTRLPEERRSDAKYIDRSEVVLDRRSYSAEEDDEYRRSNSRTRTPYDEGDRGRSPAYSVRRDPFDDDRYPPRRSSPDDDEYRSRPRGDYDADRSRDRERYDRGYSRDDDRYDSKDELSRPSLSRKYDRYPADEDDRIKRRDPDSSGLRKELPMLDMHPDDRTIRSRPERLDDRPLRPVAETYPLGKSGDSRSYTDSGRRSSTGKEALMGSSGTSVYSREPSEVKVREKRFQDVPVRPKGPQDEGLPLKTGETDRGERGDSHRPQKSEFQHEDDTEIPRSAKDVIEAVLRHTEVKDESTRKVFYPVFDPRGSNLTSPDVIRQSERRGSTITARRRRKRTN